MRHRVGVEPAAVVGEHVDGGGAVDDPVGELAAHAPTQHQAHAVEPVAVVHTVHACNQCRVPVQPAQAARADCQVSERRCASEVSLWRVALSAGVVGRCCGKCWPSTALRTAPPTVGKGGSVGVTKHATPRRSRHLSAKAARVCGCLWVVVGVWLVCGCLWVVVGVRWWVQPLTRLRPDKGLVVGCERLGPAHRRLDPCLGDGRAPAPTTTPAPGWKMVSRWPAGRATQKGWLTSTPNSNAPPQHTIALLLRAFSPMKPGVGSMNGVWSHGQRGGASRLPCKRVTTRAAYLWRCPSRFWANVSQSSS